MCFHSDLDFGFTTHLRARDGALGGQRRGREVARDGVVTCQLGTRGQHQPREPTAHSLLGVEGPTARAEGPQPDGGRVTAARAKGSLPAGSWGASRASQRPTACWMLDLH